MRRKAFRFLPLLFIVAIIMTVTLPAQLLSMDVDDAYSTHDIGLAYETRAERCILCGGTDYFITGRQYEGVLSVCYYMDITCNTVECGQADRWIYPHYWYEDMGRVYCSVCGYSPNNNPSERDGTYDELLNEIDRVTQFLEEHLPAWDGVS